MEALVKRSSQHGFKPRHFTALALLPISVRVVSGFNQRKPPSRTIAIAVDISKSFDKVSHRLLIEMIHRSRLCHNLVRWLVAYLRGLRASRLYQQHHSPTRQVRAGVPQRSVISPAFFNHFVLDCPIPDLYITSCADDFTLLSSAPTLDTHFTFGPHAHDCVERASSALNVIKALAGSNWGFTTKTLVATYKASVRLILNYASPIWFTQVSSSRLGKLEVIQSKALRIATGCHQQSSHLRAENGVLPLRAHLELCSQQFYASALQPFHPSHLIVTSPHNPCPSGLTSRPHITVS